MAKNVGWFSKAVERLSGSGDASENTPTTTIGSPLCGRLIQLSDIADEMFSTGIMGPGIGVVPSLGELRAPFGGTVQAVFPTGHAVGIVSDEGLEVLMHIGIDTVDLQGRHFEILAENGQQVVEGELLIRFDPTAIQAESLSIGTPVVILNADGWDLEIAEPADDVGFGHPLVRATKTRA